MPIEANEVGADALAIKITRDLLVNADGTVGFEAYLREAMVRGKTRFEFRLHGLKYLNSTEIGAMLRAAVLVRGGGGRIALLELNKKIHDVLIVAKVDTLFEIRSSSHADG